MLSSHKAFYIFILAFSIVVILFVNSFAKLIPLTIDHAVYICQKTFNNSVISIPHSMPLLFTTIFAFIFIYGVLLFSWKYFITCIYINSILKQRINVNPELKKLSKELSLLNRLDLVNYSSPLSFSYGLVYPRVCISTALINSLTRNELRAVLTHELSHIKNYDPFKIMLTQVVTAMFFFVPILKDFQKYFALTKEVDADRLALSAEGGSSDLKMALVKLLNGQSASAEIVARFTDNSDLEERIAILVDKNKTSYLKVSGLNIALTLLFFISLIVFIQIPVYAVETSTTKHSYFICSSGTRCITSCKEEGVIKELPFSTQQKFTPITYSPSY